MKGQNRPKLASGQAFALRRVGRAGGIWRTFQSEGHTGIRSNRPPERESFLEIASRGREPKGQEAPSKELGAGGFEPIIERR
jgi:hypothetical protein